MPLFEGDAGWPAVDDVIRRLDVADDSVHATEVGVILEAAIDQIKAQRGDWDEEVDVPTAALAEAALDRAVELASDRVVPREERKSEQLLMGQRERFPIA